MNGLEIRAATEGGYFVIRSGFSQEYRDVSFAGTLEQCLEFIKRTFKNLEHEKGKRQ